MLKIIAVWDSLSIRLEGSLHYYQSKPFVYDLWLMVHWPWSAVGGQPSVVSRQPSVIHPVDQSTFIALLLHPGFEFRAEGGNA